MAQFKTPFSRLDLFLHMAIWHSGFSGVNKSFGSSDSGYFAGSVMIPKRFFLNQAKALEKGRAWDSSRSFCLKCSSSSTRQLWKNLHNLFKRLKATACTDLTENWHLCENERLWILQKDDVVFFAVANLVKDIQCWIFVYSLEMGKRCWSEDEVHPTHSHVMEGLPQSHVSCFLLWFPSIAWQTIFDLFVSLFPPPPYRRLLLADVAQP